MNRLTNLLVGFVALEHAWFLVLEMVLWTRPIGLALTGMTPEVAQTTAVLAANQGFYNGILCAGLVWSLMTPDVALARTLQRFFLGAVLGAGIYGGLTAMWSILALQALPATIALALVWSRNSAAPYSQC